MPGLGNETPFVFFLIGVIIVTYNSSRVILDSISDLVAKDDVKVCVVDNNSSDDTVRLLQSKYGNSIEIIRNSTNLGYGVANNIGIEKLDSNFYLLANPDASISYKNLKKLYEIMQADPKLGILAPNFTDNLEMMNNFSDSAIHTKDYVTFGIVLVRREMLDKIGKFDEKIFMYFEDLDLCKRAWDGGYKVAIASGINAYHKGGGSSSGGLGLLFFKQRQQEISRMYYKLKHGKYSVCSMYLRYFIKYLALTTLYISLCNLKKSIKYCARLTGVAQSFIFLKLNKKF